MNNIEPFIQFLQHQKRYSINTVTAYKKDLEQLFEFSSKTYQVTASNQLSSSIIRSWMVELKEQQNSNRTINRKISSVKTFFKYLKKNGIISSNPLSTVITPKTSKSLPYFLKTTETEDLFSLNLFPDNFIGKRDSLILELFYATGMRLSELTNLTTHSINLNVNTVKVVGKRNKERIIPITNNLATKIKDYLISKDQLFDNTSLFVTEKGKKIYTKLVYRIVIAYLSSITKNNKKSPHILRHTFATHMLNNGADINTIKEILGHSSLSATQVYTHNSIEKLKTIHKLAHPKA